MNNKQLREAQQTINYRIAVISDSERTLRIELEGLAKQKEALLVERKNLGEEM